MEVTQQLHFWFFFFSSSVICSHIREVYILNYSREQKSKNMISANVTILCLEKKRWRSSQCQRDSEDRKQRGNSYLILRFNWAGFTLSTQHQRQQEKFYRLFLFTIYRGVVPGAFHDHFYLHQSTLISLLS